MKQLSKFFLLLLGGMHLMTLITAQTYTHPTTGLNGTYAGTCMVNTCSGTYYDNGGAGGNYAANVNNIYRTFCPSTAGMCVRATFTAFSMNDTYFLCTGPGSCCDYLRIRNGAYQNAPLLYNACGASPGTITANNSSGCLTFQFISDGSVQLAGWAATLSCVACAIQQTGTNTDCPTSTVICSNSNITANSPGPGLTSDGCATCIEGGETYSNWYVFAAQTNGTIGMTITPSSGTDDYDFALFGPGATNCASLGAPVRCSYSATAGNTGMGNGAVDNSEGVGGDSWVAPINVTAGQVYRLLVTHWSPPSGSYTISWQLTNGASLDCTPPLPVELTDFRCEAVDNQMGIYWTTETETNSDYFILEKSIDGVIYNEIARVEAQKNSNEKTDYVAADFSPNFGDNYYRLIQVDQDGKSEVFNPTYCKFGDKLPVIMHVTITDMSGMIVYDAPAHTQNMQEVVENLAVKSGIYILYTTYEDGSTNFRKFVKI